MSQFTLVRGERYSMALEVQYRGTDNQNHLDLTSYQIRAIVKSASSQVVNPAPTVTWLDAAPTQVLDNGNGNGNNNRGPKWPTALFRWPVTDTWPEGNMTLTLALTAPDGDTIYTTPTPFMVQR